MWPKMTKRKVQLLQIRLARLKSEYSGAVIPCVEVASATLPLLTLLLHTRLQEHECVFVLKEVNSIVVKEKQSYGEREHSDDLL